MSDKSWFTIENKAEEKKAVINIYGYIGGFDITATELMRQVNDIGVFNTLEVHINSYGGEVFEGVAIYNWLKSQKAKIETVIDSVAASTASFIFLAGEKRTVYDTSMGMIHLPTGFSMGTAEQMRKDADVLDKVDKNTIRKIYKSVVGEKLTDENINEMMENETWLDADELVEYGFATDRISDKSENVDDKYKNASGGREIKTYGFNKLPERITNVFKNEMSVKIENSVPVKPENKQPKEEGIMPEVTVLDAAKIQDEAAKVERKRIADINKMANAMNVTGDIVGKMIDEGKSVVDALEEFTAAKKISDSLPQNAQKIPPKTPDIQIVADDADKFRAGASVAICMAAGIPVSDAEKSSVRQSEMPTSVHGLLRATLVRNGMNASKAMNLNPSELTRQSLLVARNAVGTGTGDLTNVLADTVNKSIGIGYSNAPSTFGSWVKTVPVSDFKNYSVAKVSTFGDMDTIPEGFPFQQGAISDKKEQGAVSVKGKSLNISMQTFVNDDAGALTRIPQMMGAAYNWQQNKAVYDYLFGSAAVGPTLLEADSNGGYTAFNTYRNNFASGAGVPSVSTLSTARIAMRNQTAPKGKASDTAQRLNLVPSFIISGTTQETTIEQLLMTRTDVASAGSLAYNPFAVGGRNQLQIIIDAYLDSLSTTVWYLAANQNMIESIVLLALNGQLAPTVRSEESRVGEALGVNYDVFGAYAPMMVDFRGMYCHKGA